MNEAREDLYGKAIDVGARGRYATFGKAVEAAFASIQGQLTERNAFFDSLPERWSALFPTLRAVPGRYEGGVLFLYVRSAPLLFLTRLHLKAIKARLKTLPDAPKQLVLKLEVRA